MAIRKRCKYKICTNGRWCLEHLLFDVKHQGTRYRMGVNDFAIPRMEPGKQRPVVSMEEVRDWERRFIGEVKAGRDPRRSVVRPASALSLDNVPGFLDAYLERCVKPAGLRSETTVRSRVAVLKTHLGNLPLEALEIPDEINRFKTDSDYADEVELATIHRVLETLRAAINWGMAKRHRSSTSRRSTVSACVCKRRPRRRAIGGYREMKSGSCSTRPSSA